MIRLEEARHDAMTSNIVQKHVAWLRDLGNKGVLLECGPCDDGTAIILLRCTTREEAIEISKSDPFSTYNIYETRTVIEFKRATKENNYLLS